MFIFALSGTILGQDALTQGLSAGMAALFLMPMLGAMSLADKTPFPGYRAESEGRAERSFLDSSGLVPLFELVKKLQMNAS